MRFINSKQLPMSELLPLCDLSTMQMGELIDMKSTMSRFCSPGNGEPGIFHDKPPHTHQGPAGRTLNLFYTYPLEAVRNLHASPNAPLSSEDFSPKPPPRQAKPLDPAIANGTVRRRRSGKRRVLQQPRPHSTVIRPVSKEVEPVPLTSSIHGPG